MNLKTAQPWMTLAAIAVLQTGCAGWKFTRVPPGQAVEVALAKKATPVQNPVAKSSRTSSGPAVEPALPQKPAEAVLSVADFFTMGSLCMEQGNYAEAIRNFENALKLDPNYSEALNDLAICYQNSGQADMAIKTFQKYKAVTSR